MKTSTIAAALASLALITPAQAQPPAAATPAGAAGAEPFDQTVVVPDLDRLVATGVAPPAGFEAAYKACKAHLLAYADEGPAQHIRERLRFQIEVGERGYQERQTAPTPAEPRRQFVRCIHPALRRVHGVTKA